MVTRRRGTGPAPRALRGADQRFWRATVSYFGLDRVLDVGFASAEPPLVLTPLPLAVTGAWLAWRRMFAV